MRIVLSGLCGLLVATVAYADKPSLARYVGMKSTDLILHPLPGLAATGDAIIAAVPGEGYTLATADKRGVLLLDRRVEPAAGSHDDVQFVIEAVVEVPVATELEDVATTCDGKPTIAVMAKADRCSGKRRPALQAWRVVGHQLRPAPAHLLCTPSCESSDSDGVVVGH